jgi:hypothetical protein
MIKRLAFLFLGTTLFLSSCTETPFVPNTNNEIMVGEWNIDEVDNSDALVSGTELMTSFMNEKFTLNTTLVFDKGPKFHLRDNKGEIIFEGQYSIPPLKNNRLRLKIEDVIYNYDLETVDNSTYAVNSMTAGETVKLVISKQTD